MRLFELCGADPDLRFSPFVWRARLALAHKGLEAECVPTRFLEKEPYAPSGSKTVPVLEDNGKWIADSWAIACYLEEQYPDRPSLFGGEIGRSEARLINVWVDSAVTRTMFPMYAADVWDCLEEPDKSYFRETREKRIGRSLEEARDEREALLDPLAKALTPLRATLGEQPFICGDSPAYADYCAFTPFLWAHCASRFECLAADDPVTDWRARMFDVCDGLPRTAKRAA